ncbi:hypothetical protein GHA01_30010 [Novacetimonas hansenii]|uniref:Uncharacterized protein n=1 Tax=Novacetimonas hansenii TaxID=436 RepID=A0ABQ0SIF4_NOVHA|nr:hypothetical protein Gaha_0044_007 [Novacetimonas hansenii JCM 7643]GBQ52600.1 hypothetical protein AA0243_0077 [Novacetimonas hansenii NRIC 0243]GEC65152.1 hypothetical protein GHA01_30010 [Novacetimonas hansenii]
MLDEEELSELESLELLELLLSAEEPEPSALLLEALLEEDVAEQPDAVAPAPTA